MPSNIPNPSETGNPLHTCKKMASLECQKTQKKPSESQVASVFSFNRPESTAKDGFFQLGAWSQYGFGGLLSTPLWDVRFSTAAFIGSTLDRSENVRNIAIHSFFFCWENQIHG